MLRRRPHTKPSSDALTSEIMDCVQRLEREQAEFRVGLEGGQLRLLTAQIVGVEQLAPVIGAAAEKFAQASARRPFGDALAV